MEVRNERKERKCSSSLISFSVSYNLIGRTQIHKKEKSDDQIPHSQPSGTHVQIIQIIAKNECHQSSSPNNQSASSFTAITRNVGTIHIINFGRVQSPCFCEIGSYCFPLFKTSTCIQCHLIYITTFKNKKKLYCGTHMKLIYEDDKDLSFKISLQKRSSSHHWMDLAHHNSPPAIFLVALM